MLCPCRLPWCVIHMPQQSRSTANGKPFVLVIATIDSLGFEALGVAVVVFGGL